MYTHDFLEDDGAKKLSLSTTIFFYSLHIFKIDFLLLVCSVRKFCLAFQQTLCLFVYKSVNICG